MMAQSGRRSSRRVLIVDDSIDTANMMQLLLEREGFEVRTAYDGSEAIDVANSFLPDVILLDLTLPGLSGEEVAVRLRDHDAFADILIIAISGYESDGVTLLGFDHLMVKPVDHDALLKLLEAGRMSEQPPWSSGSSNPAD